MSIVKLVVNNLRIIKHAQINPSEGINVLVGANATGKTSLLEAIDCLSRGRSFRSRNTSDLITHGQLQFTIAAVIKVEQGREVQLGLEKTTRSTRIHLQGKRLNSVAEIAETLPVQVIHSNSHDLIQGPPKQRRAFLDWGVFHVKPDFLVSWKRYYRALRQRNSLLRRGENLKTSLFWNEELAESAERIDLERRAYLEVLHPEILKFTRLLLKGRNITLEYHRGWSSNQDLGHILRHNLENDARKGFTAVGPHMADLKIKFEGRLALDIASRGQQKLLVAVLRMAQISLFNQLSRRPCILLIDDLPSELDESNRNRFLEGLENLKIQVFFTSITYDDLENYAWQEMKVFHVKHGTIRESLVP